MLVYHEKNRVMPFVKIYPVVGTCERQVYWQRLTYCQREGGKSYSHYMLEGHKHWFPAIVTKTRQKLLC